MFGDSVRNFRPGQRVQLHPVTTAWISGDRYGTVTKVGRIYVEVRRDSGRVGSYGPEYLKVVSK